MSEPGDRAVTVYRVHLTEEDLVIALQAMDEMTVLGRDATRLAQTQARVRAALAAIEKMPAPAG